MLQIHQARGRGSLRYGAGNDRLGPISNLVGRGGLEPPASAVISPERCASRVGTPSIRRGVIRRGKLQPAYLSSPRPRSTISRLAPMTGMRQLLAILTILILVACGRPPAASVSTAPAASSRTTSPSPSTVAFGPCQLPVLLSASPGQIGWLALPGGQFSPDPSANAVSSIYGNVAWDSGIGKWLPTRQPMISPDGSAYIPDAPDLNEIVDANTGTIIHEIAPGPGYFQVAGWTSAGIYLLGGSGKSPVPGLWHVDPTTGAVIEVPGSANPRAGWSLVDESAAWASVINSDNSASLLRLDLSTGDVRTVYTSSSNQWAALTGRFCIRSNPWSAGSCRRWPGLRPAR
jgi:hypothetical protein